MEKHVELYFDYEEDTAIHFESESDIDDDGYNAHDQYTTKNMIFNLLGASWKKLNTWGLSHSVPISFKDNKTFFVVIIRYTDGNTFGTTHGLVHIQEVYTSREEAEKMCSLIELDDLALRERQHGRTWRLDDGTSSYRSRIFEAYTMPYDGYFSSLDYVQICEVEVNETLNGK